MDPVTKLLRDLVWERVGIYVDDTDLLMEKLSTLILERGFTSPLDYYYLLKYDASAETEWAKVIDAVSVRETYFFREYDQIRVLVDVILPRYFEKPIAPFRIWSAACASGEEPLTLAMAIDRAGLSHLPIEIVASDASNAALRTAQLGVYAERSFRNTSPDIWARYFKREEKGWRVDEKIHRRIQWRQANLTKAEEIAPLAAANAIFCRNVFIYFRDETIQRIVKVFAKYMLSPACLFLGAPESLLRLTSEFELQDVGGAFLYVRAMKEESRWNA